MYQITDASVGHEVVSLRPHGLEHARLLCPPLSPGGLDKTTQLKNSQKEEMHRIGTEEAS